MQKSRKKYSRRRHKDRSENRTIPPEYDFRQQCMDKIIVKVRHGFSLNEAAHLVGVPKYMAQAWFRNIPSFRDQVRYAKEQRERRFRKQASY